MKEVPYWLGSATKEAIDTGNRMYARTDKLNDCKTEEHVEEYTHKFMVSRFPHFPTKNKGSRYAGVSVVLS